MTPGTTNMHHLILGKVLTKFFTGELCEGFNNKVELIPLFSAVEDLICIRRLTSHVHIRTILQVSY